MPKFSVAPQMQPKPEKTEPEHVMELRSRRDGMLEPLLLVLQHGHLPPLPPLSILAQAYKKV